MITSTGKPVKVVKRIERERIKATDSSADSRTPAQLRREMAAVIISWMGEKKDIETRATPTQRKG